MKLCQGQITIEPQFVQGTTFRLIWKMACARGHSKVLTGPEEGDSWVSSGFILKKGNAPAKRCFLGARDVSKVIQRGWWQRGS
jgi:hypothetical protein